MQPLDAFLSRSEQRLIGAVFTHPGKDFGTLELLNRMGSSRGAGSAIIKRWLESGLLLERRVGNQRRLAANQEFVLYPELRKMVLKTVGLTVPLARALAPLVHRLSDAFVFGSFASSNDTSKSDIDLAVIGDVDLFAVSPLLDAVESELGRPVHANVYRPSEWDFAEDPVLTSIKTGPKIDLMEAIREQAG